LAEIDLLTVAHRRQQERDDRRAALIAWLTAEMNRDRNKRGDPYTLEEVVSWLGHGFQRVAPPPLQGPATSEELLDRAHTLNELYGSTMVNGHRQEHDR